ncbi:protein of unknown function [Mucilaginibacter lappiensis]|uniref:DUF4397 domain-containing protein n=1 Tax=Mucilaginibacter lappiensis TaxID=354630 RepID=A0ABR6PM34_9SPHI|nr:DUF4397 domain-containing protein [Mucilaginibacter lappiensis]MBB6110822.1 hypothetical protein [Mucilaginibacter lappiensis]SIR62778.1 protein of unknown function [Mucilaginibacter lappiensis]
MTKPNKNSFLVSFLLVIVGTMLLPFVSSCGKGANANPTGLNTQLQIVNLSPDIQPVNLYLNFIKENTTNYTYPTNSGYFFISTLVPPLQLRSVGVAPVNLLTINSAFKANSKYTLFITGFKSDSSIKKSILVLDTATIPPLGRGIVRFVHCSPTSAPLDLRANDSTAKQWKSIAFDSVSKYVQLPVGNYNFTINLSSSPGNIQFQLPNVTIQDGRAYTIYTQGIVGRTDSVAFGAAILTNNLLLKTTQ